MWTRSSAKGVKTIVHSGTFTRNVALYLISSTEKSLSSLAAKERRMTRNILAFICCVFLFTACSKAEMKKAPDFTLQDIKGNTVKLSDYAGKAVIINFWATWCPPCKQELPDFVNFYNSYRSKDIVIIGIAVGSTLEDVKKVAAEHNITYPLCMSDGKIESLYGATRFIPTTVIIDRKGNIRYNQPGMISEKDLIKNTDSLL